MGVLSRIMEPETAPAAPPPATPPAAAAPHSPPPAPKTSWTKRLPLAPCPACGSPIWWIDVYEGGPHCWNCHQPPAESFVLKKFHLVLEPGGKIGYEGDQDYQRECNRFAADALLPATPTTAASQSPAPAAIPLAETFELPGVQCDRCGSSRFCDVPITDGRTRRDCAKCGRFHSFPKWTKAGSDAA